MKRVLVSERIPDFDHFEDGHFVIDYASDHNSEIFSDIDQDKVISHSSFVNPQNEDFIIHIFILKD